MKTEFQLASKNNRRYKKRASLYGGSDGTVKTETLLEVLAEELCSYCFKFIRKNNRTIDHKIPIIRDGLHSKHNLVMACKNCNSKKSCLTYEEFVAVKDSPIQLRKLVNYMSRVVEEKVERQKLLTN